MYQVQLTAQTVELIESHRRSSDESVDEIIRRQIAAAGNQVKSERRIGCELGSDAVLFEGEKIFFFRSKEIRDAFLRGLQEPDAWAVANEGQLFLFGIDLVKQKDGSIVQPALKMVQERRNDSRNKNGQLISLNAWDYWHVIRNGRCVSVGELRNPAKIVRRGRVVETSKLGATDLGL